MIFQMIDVYVVSGLITLKFGTELIRLINLAPFNGSLQMFNFRIIYNSLQTQLLSKFKQRTHKKKNMQRIQK